MCVRVWRANKGVKGGEARDTAHTADTGRARRARCPSLPSTMPCISAGPIATPTIVIRNDIPAESTSMTSSMTSLMGECIVMHAEPSIVGVRIDVKA